MTFLASLLGATATTACILLGTTAALAQVPRGPTPAPTAQATEARIAGFVPKGYHVIDQASADFDGDGLADLVVVFGNAAMDNENGDEAVCPLLVLLAQPSGGWTVSARARIDCTPHQGPHGSGFDKVTARRNTFLVRTVQNLDSSEARFQWRGGRWLRIGAKSTSFTTSGPPGMGEDAHTCFVQKMARGDTCTGHDIDSNFLTGEVIESSEVNNEREKTVRRKLPIAPLAAMGEWVP